MRDLLDQLVERLAAGHATVSVTAIEVFGSAPCAAGGRIIVSQDDFRGTIGGGNLEFLALEQARKLMATDQRCLRQSIALGPILAQCCGGRVTLLYESFRPDDLHFFAASLAHGGYLATRCDGQDYGKWLVGHGIATGLPGSAEAPALSCPLPLGQFSLDGKLSWERINPARQRVCIFGAGHVGQALARVLSVCDCDLVVVDPRPDYAARFAETVIIAITDCAAAMEDWWRPGAIAVILTHNHELDYYWASTLLRRGDFSYCGVIGSDTKRARFRRRLRGEGFDQQTIDRLVCPIGVPDLKSKEPGAVAISTAAQLLPLLTHLSAGNVQPRCDCTPAYRRIS